MRSDKLQVKKVLARNMKKYRTELGLTQEAVAELAGMTVKYWQRLEMLSQEDLPSLPTLFKIAKVLKIPPSKLLDF